MGTRNITNVYVNGTQKLCQYCQWDGYPTGAGREIMDFIRRSDDDRMVERLADVELHVSREGELVYFTGYPATDEVDAVLRDEWEFFAATNYMTPYDERKRIARRKVVEKYGPTLVMTALLASRDTGCDTLGIIYDSECHVDAWTSPYLLGNAGDWQIEAVWKLDYDNKALTGIWHDEPMTWTFEEIRGWSEDEMVSVLKAYEGWGED